jgi:putative hydrolase of HD superfamily
VHDLVEVYAGDSFALDPVQVATKAEKETAAMKRLESDLLTNNFAVSIQEYESLANEEAKFIYSLDKLMPAFGVLYGGESIWKDHNMSQPDWESKFRAKIETSQYTAPYLKFVIDEQKKHPELFA